jgi:hypothetical protein
MLQEAEEDPQEEEEDHQEQEDSEEDQEDLPKSSYNLIDFQESSSLEDLRILWSPKIWSLDNLSTTKRELALKSTDKKLNTESGTPTDQRLLLQLSAAFLRQALLLEAKSSI